MIFACLLFNYSNNPSQVKGRSALRAAAEKGDIETVRTLVDNGVDVPPEETFAVI